MANRAIHWESRGGVIRIGSRLELRQVAGAAIRRHTLEIAVYVALRALHRGVRAGKRERRTVVIKRRARPGYRGVADRAIHRESRGGVIRIGSRLELG